MMRRTEAARPVATGARLRAVAVVPALVLASLLLMATPAAADPPGPTDYLSRIDAIEPPTTAFAVSIVGGDSFVLLEQREPSTIEVTGYEGEPYLRFSPDGTVERNRNSPARYLNDDRFGDDTAALPERADADAAPDWEAVADDGRYAWHDHRAHWMLRTRPLGLGPGDRILEGVIPMTLDGAAVKVTVVSTWQPAPSPVPAAAGSVVGAVASLVWWRRRFDPAALLAGAAPAGLVVGAAQFLSLPGETDPSPTLWLLPGLAVVAALVAVAVRSRPQSHLPLVFGGGVALFVWGVVRVESLPRSILPTDLPFWVDRGLTAATLVTAFGVVVISAVRLSRLLGGAPRVATGGSPAT